jgi:hypothetical protein
MTITIGVQATIQFFSRKKNRKVGVMNYHAAVGRWGFSNAQQLGRSGRLVTIAILCSAGGPCRAATWQAYIYVCARTYA